MSIRSVFVNKSVLSTTSPSLISIIPSLALFTSLRITHPRTFIFADDPDSPTFHIVPLINPISLRGATPNNVLLVSHEDSIFGPDDNDDDELEMPDEVWSLNDNPLENDLTADGIALW